MSHLLSYLLIFSLVGEPAFANGDHHGHQRPAPADAAKPTDPVAPAADAAKDATALAGKCDLSLPNPLDIPNKKERPIEPKGFTEGTPELQPVPQQNADTYQFDRCDKVRTSTGGDMSCDKTLAFTFVLYRARHQELQKTTLDGKTKIEDQAKTCATDQTKAQQCMAEIYKNVGQQFATLAKELRGDVAKLKTHYVAHFNKAQELIDPTKAAGRAIASTPILATHGSHYLDFAKAADFEKLRRPAEPASCLSPMIGVGPNTTFCDRVTASTEANFFQKKFLAAAEAAEKTAACYGQGAKTAQARAEGNGNPDGGNGNGNGNGNSTVTGKTGLGFGLDDMMKLGTLGLTGAALYCSVSKSCSQQQQNNADQNAEPNSGSTSPTPNGQNPQQETSSLGSNGGSGASQPAPGAPTTTAVDTGSSHGGGGGGLDSALQHFNGSLDSRAPASTPATGSSSGGGSGGAPSLGGGSSASQAAAAAVPDYKAPDGIGLGLGAGGLASGGGSAGGFNLGSSAGASPTDNALKNILNGDAPPGLDAGLGTLGDLGGLGAAAPQAGNDGKDDPENLFNRVRVTHVRCLKRGCVGAGVGDNI